MEAVKLYNDKQSLVLGEGPSYRQSDSTLHFNDFGRKQVHIVPIIAETGEVDQSRPHIVHDTKDIVTVQFFRENKPGYACLYHQGYGLLDEQTGDLQVLRQVQDERHIARMNDGCVDPKGRFWGGELDFEATELGLAYQKKYAAENREPIGRLWCLDTNGELKLVIKSGLAISNGIGFSPDHTKFYLNDSLAQRTYVFDFDVEAGTLHNQRVLRCFRDSTAEPDGLVVDVNGNLWIALYKGHAVVCIDGKSGELLHRVEVPAESPTCPGWGGANNDMLFITSAEGKNPEVDGQVYRIKTDVQGMPNYLSKN